MNKAKKLKVLVADESLTVQKQVNVALASSNYEVFVAADGQDALSKLKIHRPDVVLADCALRYLDGFDLIEKVRADSSMVHVRAILLKGQIPKGKERRLKEVRFDEVLPKPIDYKSLMRVIEAVLQDEESTAIKPEASVIDEDLTPIVRIEAKLGSGKVEKMEVLNSKLSAIAEEVVGNRLDVAEITGKVRPEDFRNPVVLESQTREPSQEKDSSPKIVIEAVVREETRKWISENMSRIVEKLVKDELNQFTKGSR